MNWSSIRRVIQFGNYRRTMTQGGVPRLTIGTHDGSFHCDEALGCWMLKKTTRFQDAEVIRTRDKDHLKTLDVVLDVGDIYDPGKVCSSILDPFVDSRGAEIRSSSTRVR